MPPNLSRQCPKCKHVNTYDWVQLNSSFGPIYIQPEQENWPREFPVKCKQCGHEFIILVYKEEVGDG